MEGSQQSFRDVASLLACAGPVCIFCQQKELGNKDHLLKKHHSQAVYFQRNNEETFVISCFCKDGHDITRSHYHCPLCNFTVFARAVTFMNHLKVKHGITSAAKRKEKSEPVKRRPVDASESPAKKGPGTKSLQCQHCKAAFPTQKNLRRHIQDVHHIDPTPMMCIDIQHGIYVTVKYDHGPVFPIHVIKSTNTQKIDCEMDQCRKFMQIAWSSGNPGKECVHLERTATAKPYSKPAALTSTSLQDMQSKGLMSSVWGEKCEDLNKAAVQSAVDSVFPVPFGDFGYSQRFMFFSIFTNERDNWCQFGRTRVSFDSAAGKWNCQCRGTGTSHRCIHRMMAMWWMFQELPHALLATADNETEDIDDLESHIIESSQQTEEHTWNSADICAATEYIYSKKRIPPLTELPIELRTKEAQIPTCFVPSENTCPYCPGPTPPALSAPKVVTTQATVYGINSVHKGVSVAVKECPACCNVVRFQDYDLGFHNFNNHVLLTLPLCELLVSGLANKTTSGRMLSILTFFNDNRYHHQTVRRAFHHFLSLTNFKFEFTCYQCGYHPAVLVADANWKLAFDIPLGTFKRPDPETLKDTDLEIDIVKAWMDLDKCLIAEGLLLGSPVANPYSSTLGHSTLAPWIGERSRVGDVVPKTEGKKAMRKRPDDVSPPSTNINEDVILQLIESKKPQKKDLQDACHALGVSAEGSMSDMLNRLQELLNFKEVYPKLFVKLQKAGGGVLHFSCVHGVVYYVNFLFWTESARDHTDGLLSFKYFPTCYISDVAGQVARHTNNRTKQLFFQPHDGRLCAPSSDNIKLALNKDLKVEMAWVRHLRSPLPYDTPVDSDRFLVAHPVTGTSDRYALYDRFHQKNQKRPEEKLRSLNMCPQLRTEVNSSVAEQFNRELASVKYSLCQMKEIHFKQTLRVMMDLHNESINKSFQTEMEVLCNTQLSVGIHGMLGIHVVGGRADRDTAQQNTAVKPSFVASSYAVTDRDKKKLKELLSGSRDESQVIAQVTMRFPMALKDLKSICPSELLESSSLVMPWLTDDAVNFRVAQLAHEHGYASLATFDFILWHREWKNRGTVSDTVVQRLPVSRKIFLPRIVGHSTPETGNHFILWVFNFTEKTIHVYDSLTMYPGITNEDMTLLKDVFRNQGGLHDWTVTSPPQWRQQDTVNCGVFVCSAAEMEAKRINSTSDAVTSKQCRILRLHHAAKMVEHLTKENFPPTAEEISEMDKKEAKLQQEESRNTGSSSHCLAWKIKCCLFQRATGTTCVFHSLVKKYTWLQCGDCKNWLHFECAGVKGNWSRKDFSCGCNVTRDINNIVASAKAEDILTDAEIKDIEIKLQSGYLLSNRMYLWKQKGFDPLLRQHYLDHHTIFDEDKTLDMTKRLQKVLCTQVTASRPELLGYITEVILPEVLSQWLQMTFKMCRYEAESVIFRGPGYVNKDRAKGQDVGPASGQGQGPASGQGQGPAKGQDVGPASGQGQGPASGQGQGPATGQGQGPATGQDVGPASGQGQGPATGQGQGPATGQDVGPASGQGQGPATGQGQGPATGQD